MKFVKFSGEGYAPIHLAVLAQDDDILQVLMKSNDLIDQRCTTGLRQTPLLLALHKMNFKMALLLVASGADVNACDALGFSSLHYACRDGDLPTIWSLMASGADPTIRDIYPYSMQSMLTFTPQYLESFMDQAISYLLGVRITSLWLHTC